MNTNTAVGKTLKTLLWVAISTGLIAALSYVVNQPMLFNPTVVGLANILIVLVKNVADPKVKNI